MFLRVTAAAAVVHFSHCNFVCLSVSLCLSHGWISQKWFNSAS